MTSDRFIGAERGFSRLDVIYDRLCQKHWREDGDHNGYHYTTFKGRYSGIEAEKQNTSNTSYFAYIRCRALGKAQYM